MTARLRVPPVGSAPSLSVAGVIGLLVALVALYFGRDVLIPLALAVLLAFALSPIVSLLRRRGLPRVLAVLLVCLLFIALITAVALVVSNQLVELASNLPQYRGNLSAKIESLRDMAPAGGTFTRLTTMIGDLGSAVSEAFGAAGQAADRPLAVRIEGEDSTIWAVWSVLEPMLAPIGQAGITLILLVFLLLEREDLRNRLIWLFGEGDLTRATAALDDAAGRLGQLLLAQVALNMAYGTIFALGLWAIGVPNPLLWGIISGFLRFIPIIGTIVGGAFPAFVAFAADPGWTTALACLALIVTLDILANNVVEPLLYGNRTGLSSFAVLVAMVFWATLWGIPGLLLATPLTVCLAVLGRHIPQLGFLDVLLGSTPALSPDARIYQRLLAEDPLEAAELAETAMAETSRREVFESIMLAVARRAQEDRERGALEGMRRRAVAHGILAVVEDLNDEPLPPDGPYVACLAMRDELDQACAGMLRQLLSDEGIRAVALPPGTREAPEGLTVIAACWSGRAAPSAIDRSVRRANARLGPSLPTMIVMPITGTAEATAVARATDLPASTTLGDAIDYVAKIAPETRMTDAVAPGIAPEPEAADALPRPNGFALSS
jgi:predicted PurR-regulated permease PerM